VEKSLFHQTPKSCWITKPWKKAWITK